MSFTPQYIGSDFSGLVNNVKPFLIMDAAFQTLENAYCFRGRVVKRDGNPLLGRLRRIFIAKATADFAIVIGTNPLNLYTQLGITEPNPSIETGNITTITISWGAPLSQTWTDSTGTGVMTGFDGVNITAVSINYSTGIVTIISTANFGASVPTITLNYYPSLPVMGICQYDQPGNYNQLTIIFDTIYAYQFVGSGFQELTLPGTTWAGTDNDFFSYANWRGSSASFLLFFATNFVNNLADPIRYFNGSAWTNFYPIVGQTSGPTTYTYMTQARFLIPYYGRLVALNVWENTTTAVTPDYVSPVNYYNRCRFSQIGDPTQVDAWRSDLFGKGGFIDAPVNESINNATFYKNTLIVFFQRSTWALRYVGEYGLPFLWERISSDFGSQSTFSPVLFDDGVFVVSDRAIVTTSGNDVQRIDLQIPDVVFDFEDANNAHQRIQGVRDFQKEIVYWNYVDGTSGATFPNYSLLYNYRNQTYAIFRNNVTAFGKFNSPVGITWSSLTTFWSDDKVTWGTFLQTDYLDTISGNQQGYIHYYGEPNASNTPVSTVSTPDQESLYISAINLAVSPVQLTVINHNILQNGPVEGGEIIYITGMQFVNTATGMIVANTFNNQFFLATWVDANTLSLNQWNFTTQKYVNNFTYSPANGTATYMGGGQIVLYPLMDIITKDFNPLSQQGLQAKFGHLDLLTDATENASVTVKLYRNSSLAVSSNMTIGQKSSTTALTPNGYITVITNANPAKITTAIPYNVANGLSVVFNNILGMTNGAANLNGIDYPITVIDQFNFTIPVDTTGYTAYISGGNWAQTNDPYYPNGSQYAWHRFYAGTYGSFFTLEMTYDNNLMNTISTHQSEFVLNAFRIWTQKGGASVY